MTGHKTHFASSTLIYLLTTADRSGHVQHSASKTKHIFCPCHLVYKMYVSWPLALGSSRSNALLWL